MAPLIRLARSCSFSNCWNLAGSDKEPCHRLGWAAGSQDVQMPRLHCTEHMHPAAESWGCGVSAQTLGLGAQRARPWLWVCCSVLSSWAARPLCLLKDFALQVFLVLVQHRAALSAEKVPLNCPVLAPWRPHPLGERWGLVWDFNRQGWVKLWKQIPGLVIRLCKTRVLK